MESEIEKLNKRADKEMEEARKLNKEATEFVNKVRYLFD